MNKEEQILTREEILHQQMIQKGLAQDQEAPDPPPKQMKNKKTKKFKKSKK